MSDMLRYFCCSPVLPCVTYCSVTISTAVTKITRGIRMIRRTANGVQAGRTRLPDGSLVIRATWRGPDTTGAH